MDRFPRLPRLVLPLAALAVAALALTGGALAGQVVEEPFEKTYDGNGIERVRLQNVNGPVRVGTWEKGHVRVSAVKRAKGSRAEEAIAETEIRVTKRAGAIEIETVLPKPTRSWGIFSWGSRGGAEVAYELLLPAALPVDVETVNGRVTAEKRLGPVTLNTVNGSVRVEEQGGPLHVNTVNGSVEVVFSGSLQTADLETVNGSVTVTCARDSSFRFDLQTVNGKIRSDFPDVTVEGKWGPKEARGEIAGGRERLTVETVNGEVRVLSGDATER